MTTELTLELEDFPTDSPAVGCVDIPQELHDHVVAEMNQLASATGLPWLCVESQGGMVVAKSDEDLLPIFPDSLCDTLLRSNDIVVVEQKSGLVFFGAPLVERADGRIVGVGYALSHPDARPSSMVMAATELNWSAERLNNHLKTLPHCSQSTLECLLRTALSERSKAAREHFLLREIDQLGNQIEQTYEEISLLHTLTGKLQISRSSIDLAESCLERLAGLLRAKGNIIWLEDRRSETRFLPHGDPPFDEFGMAKLIARFETHDWSRPLVKNGVSGTLLGADFPGLKNFTLVSVAEGEHRYGWILSCNLENDREFGTVEASLLSSIATILGTHLRNVDLYHQHDELILSFVRSLVSTLDAKDPYTRGHSERVALIARRIGEEMQLPDEDLQDIYLAGLLHDIGKIGVDDRILQKPGQLTSEEFEKIQEHPMIGYNILAGLKNLQRTLPGVRYHHESYNGKGYPDGLAADEIPLMARILAVADSYDAMGSNRPYREGMPPEKIEEIFRRGAGKQWDPGIIDAYFAASHDILMLCEDYSPTDSIYRPVDIASD